MNYGPGELEEAARQLDRAVYQHHSSLWPILQVSSQPLRESSNSHRWKKSEDGEWSCALHGRILSLKQDPEYLHYRAIFPTSSLPTPSSDGDSPEVDDTLQLIHHYFNLKPNLSQLYSHWSSNDPNFKKKAPNFTGVRILQQDAWEALVGFICSSNNNISRISQMVDKLCANYGPLVGHVGSRPLHDFPAPRALAGDGVEAALRALGFGYRAGYLARTARAVDGRGLAWLDGLRNPERPPFRGPAPAAAGPLVEGGRPGYRAAHEQLLGLQGVGPKVADCVCLMGLGWGEAVPVDTHVWQIAQRDYRFGKGKHASLTKATYDAVANRFRELWGVEAGWAQSVLFTANLRAFSERLVEKIEVKPEESVVEAKVSSGVVETRRVTKGPRKRIKMESEEAVLQVTASTKRRRKLLD
jgi:N-glycosylase/DNA lyase